jgi:hypothetical protein
MSSASTGTLPQIGHDRSLADLFQFIVDRSYLPTLRKYIAKTSAIQRTDLLIEIAVAR